MDPNLQLVKDSLESAKNYSIFIGALTRNSESYIDSKLSYISDNIAKLFKETTMCIYANNCTDNTYSVVHEASKKYSNLGLRLICDEVIPFYPFGPVCTKRRAKWMADCRNKYLDYFKSTYAEKKYDIVLVLDLDMYPISIDGFLHSLSFLGLDSVLPYCDAVSANGIDRFEGREIYYDTWTYIVNGKLQNCETAPPFEPRSSGVSYPYFIDSGFGGATIYRASTLLDVSYGLWHDENGFYGSEHTGLHIQLKEKSWKHTVNPLMRLYR